MRHLSLLVVCVVAGCSEPTPSASVAVWLPDAPALAADALPPISGGTLLTTTDGLVVAGDPDHARIWIVDPAAERAVGEVALGRDDEPGRMVEDAAGRVHVVLRSAGEVLTLDPGSAAEIGRTRVCAAPRGLSYDASLDVRWVACLDGTLVALGQDGEVRRRFRIERDLRDVVSTPGRLFVSRFRSAELLTVDPDTGAILERRRPAPQRVPTPASGERLEATVAWRIRPTAQGGVLMLHQRSVASAIDVDGEGYAGLFCRNGVVSPATTRFAATGDVLESSGPIGFAPLALDVVEVGGRVIVAIGAPPSAGLSSVWSTVEVLPADVTNPCAELAFPTAGAPPAVAVAAWGERLVTLHRDPTRIAVEGGPVFEMRLGGSEGLGHRLFHTGTPSFVACASCHPDGGEDGHVWDFIGVGLRRTQSLRGGLLETAPFHWAGDEPDMTAIMLGSFHRRMRAERPSGADVDAVAGWLDALPHPAGELDDAAAVRGMALFADPEVGCSSCHAGAALTSPDNRDVGTGGAYQVPSLRGVRQRPPYFHDGCAATLEDVVDGACETLDEHGRTSSLAATERADLAAYLRSL